MNCIFTDPAIEWKNVCLILYLDNYSYFALYFKKKQCIYNNVPPPPSGLLSLTHTAECLFTENNALYEQSLRGRRRGGGRLNYYKYCNHLPRSFPLFLYCSL